MNGETLMEALVLERRIGNLSHEIMDLSQQMAEAVDRDDEVTISMLISMRSEPIQKLEITNRALQELVDSVEEAVDRERLASLLKGAAAAESTEEALSKQIASNARQFEKIASLERVLNQKITRDKSIFR